MKFFRLILLFVNVLAVLLPVSALSFSPSQARREILRRTATTCDLPSLPNGKVMRRQRGKMIQYLCNAPYRLIGMKYSTCQKRRWDSPIPMCVKSGCLDISTPELQDHMVFYENNKIMATLRCRSDYILKGASVAYCDGRDWDRALGTCHMSSLLDNLSCDFESEDICGWSHDENADFRWTRGSGQPMTIRQRTGPRTDHTVGKLHEGHYMLMESFEHEDGDRAHLFSPIYSAAKSKDACYRFFYHMYGLLVGTLRVYVKPVTVDMDDVLENPKYRFFEKKGNQRNLWHEAQFNIEEMTESFQIIFEGQLRSSYFGDIAIDDVELMQGEVCIPEGATTVIVGSGTTPPEAEMEDNFSVILSCTDRCEEKTRTNKTGGCDCHSECTDSYTCCPDFGRLCLLDDPPPSSSSTTFKTTLKSTTEATTRTTRTVKTTSTRLVLVTKNVQTKATTTLKPSLNSSSEIVEPVTSYKILPKALDTEESPGLAIVSLHKTIIFVSIVGCLCVTLIVTMLVVRHIQKRRLLDPEFYKKRRHNENSNSSQSAREEFSEIRFLTEDEHLDFALATPTTFKPLPSAVPVTAQLSDDEKSGGSGSADEDGQAEERRGKRNKKDKSAAVVKGRKTKLQKKLNKVDADNEGLLGEGDPEDEDEDGDDFREW